MPGLEAYRARLRTLRELPTFVGVSDDALHRIAEHVAEIRIQPGAHLCREGSPAMEAFIIVEGTANLLEGDEVVRTIEVGELIGELAVLSGRPRTASVRAVTELKAFVLTPHDVKWMREDPDASAAVTGTVARHLSADRERRGPSDRGAMEILEGARRGGAALALIAGAVLRRAVGVLAGRGEPEEAELPDLHAGVELDRQRGDVGQLEGDVTREPGVDEAGGGVGEQAEPPE